MKTALKEFREGWNEGVESLVRFREILLFFTVYLPLLGFLVDMLN